MPVPTDGFSARILIVDDQQANLHLLEAILRRAGFVAIVTTTEPRGVVALHLESRYKLIVLDLQMPRMDGFEVMKALKQAGGEQPAILVMTADPTQRAAALEAGATSFLSKPFVLAEVVSRVRLLVGGADEPRLAA
jgi:DNA-binding response OmpR family regulator